MMRYIVPIVILFFAVASCRKKNSPKPPGQVQLVFPDRNSECTTGQSLNAETSQVEFRWEEGANVDTYELRVTNSNTGVVQTISTASTAARLPIAKGEPFSWFVRSKNTQVPETVSSEIWNFYNAGSVTTFAPFPADIIAPRMSENVFKDINNEITLSWSAADLDDDILEYEVYVSVASPPEDLVGTLPKDATTLKVTVAPNTVYYWSVITKDEEGNATNSGIYSFRVL